MRALIVGGGGAIGSAIARHARELGCDTHVGMRATAGLDRLACRPTITRHTLDARDPRSVLSVLERVKPDWIVMAALPSEKRAAGYREQRELLLGMSEGVLGTMEALRQATYAGPLIWIGSAMSYGAGGKPRDPRDALHPQTFRGAVKAAESILAAQLASQLPLSFTELRVFTGYGPFKQRDRLVATLLRAALSDQRVRLSPQPATRDWIHYRDIGGACALAASITTVGQRVFNVCSGRLHSTHQVAALMEKIVGKRLIADAAYEGGDHYGEVEPGLLPSVDWSPSLNLAQGLEQCWQWANSREGRNYLLAQETLHT